MDALPPGPFVLVVDASIDDRMLTRRAMRPLGLRVEEAVEAAQACEMARVDAPRVALVADHVRGVPAPELVGRLREACAPGALLVVHLRSREGHPPAEGADGWLMKPVAFNAYLDEVGGAVRRLLA